MLLTCMKKINNEVYYGACHCTWKDSYLLTCIGWHPRKREWNDVNFFCPAPVLVICLRIAITINTGGRRYKHCPPTKMDGRVPN